MSTQKAIQIQGPGDAKLVSDAPIPKLEDDRIIVKVAAVALNPTDTWHIDALADKGAIVGCDYAGTVEQVGKAVTRGFQKGDRVAGVTHGSNAVNHDDGAFAEHISAIGDIQAKIPDSISFEEAATLGVGVTTVGQGLYQSLGLPLPDEPAKEKFPVLIYGGSTATGDLAIQFAKLSGLEVITTCSPRNFDLVKRQGADHVFDYNSPTCAADIRKVTSDRLRHVLDCVSNEKTVKICMDSIGPQGGKYSCLLPIEKLPRDDVTKNLTMAYSATGKAYKFGQMEIPASKEDFDFAVKFWTLTQQLLEQGKLHAHPPEVRDGGLAGILDGLQDIREGKVSGVKLVYKL
ncbi:MAG: hypothetical protein M1835_007908 [Candelina submexicana]|nr:MAG: hypothetical protein M1835_007908 [Candelina submexicana]